MPRRCPTNARAGGIGASVGDRKSTRLNSSHTVISYAVFCLKKKNAKVLQHLEKASWGELNSQGSSAGVDSKAGQIDESKKQISSNPNRLAHPAEDDKPPEHR